MGYCFEKAVPHSVFLEWEPEDRAKVIAYAMEQNTRCSMCGTAPWEWEEDRFAYTAVDELCQGCYKKAVHQDSSGTTLPGTNVKLVATTPRLKAQMAVIGARRSKKLRSEE